MEPFFAFNLIVLLFLGLIGILYSIFKRLQEIENEEEEIEDFQYQFSVGGSGSDSVINRE